MRNLPDACETDPLWSYFESVRRDDVDIILSVGNESQSQKVKLCFSCKRHLPLNFFGVRLLSPDGYNPCCKECRNFRRRQAYQRPDSIDEPILPLNEHNTRFLWALPDSSRVENLVLTLQRLHRIQTIPVNNSSVLLHRFDLMY